MPDREKVIECADKCTSPVHESEDCNECPYHLNHEGFYSCIECLMRDTVALLKEQEAVPVIQREVMHMLVWCCGSCGVAITDGDKFCRNCGKAVNWE